MAYITKFTSSIVLVPGAENAVADAMSRPTSSVSTPFASTPSPPCLSAVELYLFVSSFDVSSLPALQSACPSLKSILFSPSLSVISVPFFWSSVLFDVSF